MIRMMTNVVVVMIRMMTVVWWLVVVMIRMMTVVWW